MSPPLPLSLDARGRVRDGRGRFVSERVASELVQHRDPTAATANLRFLSPGMPQVERWNSRQAIERGYLASWVVARCVQIYAEAISGLTFKAGASLPTQPTGTAEERPLSPLGMLLGPAPGGPAPEMSARALWYWTVVQRLVTGKHGWEVEWAGRPARSDVVSLWPLTSAALRAIPASGRTVQWFDRFEYGREDQPRRLSREQVFYGWDSAPDDYRQPYSMLESASLPISVAVMVGRYQVAFLRNDARPASVVVTQEFGSDDDFESFKRSWLARHRGPDQAGSTAFIEAPDDDSGVPGDASKAIHVETLGLSQRDSRMLEAHKAAMQETAAALGVPWSRIDASGRTFDNAEAEERTWYRERVLPLAVKLSEEVNLSLAPLIGSEVGWFDLSTVEALKPRPPVDAQGASVLVSSGIATVEEVRPWFGLTAEVPEGLAEPEEEPAELPPAPEPVAEPVAAAAPTPSPRATPVGRALSPEEQEARRSKIWRRNDSVAVTLEGQWRRTFERLFRRQADATLKRLEGTSRAKRWKADVEAGEVRAGGVEDLFDPRFWRDATVEEARALYESTFAAGAARISDVYGISFDLAAPYAQQFIDARANQLAGQVTDTTYRAIQQTLVEGVGAGESIPDLAARLRSVFDQAGEVRATTIARTEVVSAYNASASLAAAQLPGDVVGGQEWIATRDGRTRGEHAEADGQVVPIGLPFAVGGDVMAYPGDPAGSPGNTINCRCTVAFLTPEEMAERSRVVPLAAARALMATVRSGDEFDEGRFRRSLLEVAA